MQMNRRYLLGAGGAGLLGGVFFFGQRESRAAEGKFEIMLSDAEWRKRLTPQQYAVLRKEDTEKPGSSPLNKEKR